MCVYRLFLSSELTEAITLERFPYHFCAVTGNVNLAVFLYSRQLQYSRGITVANVSADGKAGITPWQKSITLSPVDVANMAGKACSSALHWCLTLILLRFSCLLLAGHKSAALVLSAVLAKVPLHWSRDTHSLYPRCFKQQVGILSYQLTVDLQADLHVKADLPLVAACLLHMNAQ